MAYTTKRRLRICLVYQGEFPPAERIEKVAQTLTAVGHEVFLLCTTYKPGPLREERVGDVYIVRLQPTSRNCTWNKILKFPVFFNPLWLWQIFRLVRRFHIDALQVIDLPLAIGVLAIGRMFSLPVIMDMWENYPEALKGWAKLDWRRRIFKNPIAARAVELWVTRRVDHVVTVVDEQAERLVQDGVRPECISVVTNAVDFPQFTAMPVRCDTPLDKEPDTYKLLYVGVIGVERGLDDIVRALGRLRTRIPSLRFYIAGTGSYEPYLRRLVEREGVSDLVRFPGWVTFQDIPSYIAKSDLCIVPHLYNGFINTTIPNKLFQYMALAKPILVSHAKPLARIVRECSCGFVFQSGNPADAAAKIEEAYALRTDMEIGLRGRRAVETKYNWDRVSAGFVRIYS